MLTRKYNLINNVGGWMVFIIALATYWLTLEPTASYWDCGEFIIQADKLEVGHPLATLSSCSRHDSSPISPLMPNTYP